MERLGSGAAAAADVGAGLEKGGLESQVSSEVTCRGTPLASSPEKKSCVCV